MKNIFITLILILTAYCSFGQTNTFPSSGNVGIGTLTPQAKLHVLGGEIRLAGAGTSGIASGAFITFYDSNNTTRYGFIGDGSAGNSDIYMLADAGGSLRFGTNGVSDQMDINTSGNVGIGITNPTTPLHIAKLHSAFTDIPMQKWDPLIAGYSLTLSNYNSVHGIDYVFTQLHNGTSIPVLIFQGGQVGINTMDTKGYELAVNGSAIATSMTVKLNANWPDYVFKPEYHLPSLTEVKAYIDKNQHLPDMPSTQEVEKNGQNLGEMNKLLTKKVEELTLYLIEKDNKDKEKDARLNSQQEEINQLEKQLTALTQTLNKNE